MLLVAVSGGVDSMCLAQKVRLEGGPFAIAHCNFGLRGAESDGDEAFVTQWARKNGVPCHVKRFDTERYASERGVSVEMAARELRYRWFGQLCRENGYEGVAVAHHANDNAETLLLNLLRGTGLKGICGMKDSSPLQGSVSIRLIRPLLDFSRREIEAHAVRSGVDFRIDATNADTAIPRNRIRHAVFPQLAAINPSFRQTFGAEMKHFAQAGRLLDDLFAAGRDSLCPERGGVLCIDIPALLRRKEPGWWLWRLLEEYGFGAAQLEQIEASLQAQSGKTFLSPTHRLVKDRTELRVYPLSLPDSADLTDRLDVRTFAVMPGFDPRQKPADVLFVDADKLRLPLSARPPRPGDRFRPFGMRRGSKLLSDFFTDLKLDVAQKQREVVVTMQDENGDEVIVAIAGRRIDDRFKVTPATHTVAALSWIAG